MSNVSEFIVIGHGTPDEKSIPVKAFVLAEFGEGRVGFLYELETGDFALGVKNSPESGREPEAKILLTRKSLHALMCTMHIYFKDANVDFEAELREFTPDGVAYDYQIIKP